MTSKQLTAAFIKWRLQGLTVKHNILYRIDACTITIHSIIYANRYRTDYSTKMNVIYKAKNDKTPIKLICFNEIYDGVHIENWQQRYDKRLSRLYEYSG